MTQQIPYNVTPEPAQRKGHKKLKVAGVIVAAGALVGIGAAIGSAGSSSAATKTVTLPGKTTFVPEKIPGPTVTKTVPAPPPPAGTTVGTWHGSGTETTPAFNVPASGDYIVSWTFSGNGDGFGNGGNFIMEVTNPNTLVTSLPDDISTSGHGSTEVTGDSGTDSFNVQAEDTASWTVTVVSAS